MSPRLLLLGAAVMALVAGSCLADRPPSAPWLGDRVYSFRASGSLGGVLYALALSTGRLIHVDPGPALPAFAGKRLRDIHVSIDADGETLDRILLSACGQAGAVYDLRADPNPYLNDGYAVWVHAGDPRHDPGPAGATLKRCVNERRGGGNLRWSNYTASEGLPRRLPP